MKKYAAIFAAAAMFFVQSPALCAEKAADESVFEEIYGTVKESVPPREIDKAAYELHRNYSSGKSSPPPQMGRGGTVVYAFGATVPRILCKPLRITDVELERGEVITNPPFIGDGVNWQILPSTSGKGDTLTFHIMIKPSMPDISTNLVVHTDSYCLGTGCLSEGFIPPDIVPVPLDVPWNLCVGYLQRKDALLSEECLLFIRHLRQALQDSLPFRS